MTDKQSNDRIEATTIGADDSPVSKKLSRRKFITGAGGLAASSLLGAAALLTESDDDDAQIEWAEHFQKHYRLMTEIGRAHV